MAGPSSTPETPAAVLAAVRCEAAAANAAEARKLRLAVAWAAMHSVDSITDAATLHVDGYGDTGLAVAGPGAPLVAEFSVAEFAAAVAMTTDTGRTYLGEALELRHRLPRLWHRVLHGDLVAWKARRIARATIALSRDAASYVDAMVASVAHKIGPYQLDRLIEEAIARLMPDHAEARRRAAADGRRFDIHTRETTLSGTAAVSGELDLADALDLDAALTAGAAHLKALGNQDDLDVRRATTLGKLARHQTLDLTHQSQDAADGAPTPKRRARRVVLYAHLSDEAIHHPALGDLGRLENTRSLITAEQVRRWCGDPDTQVVVKPVIDLADHVHVGAYEVPDRLHEAAALRDHTCVFPYCTRPARGTDPTQRDADCDHITPHGLDGPTCSCNLAPLCRRHHRLKTHGRWRYTPVEPGTYRWTSPHGYTYLRDHDGTLDLTPQRPASACTHPPDS
jgi:hypothetical protein